MLGANESERMQQPTAKQEVGESVKCRESEGRSAAKGTV